MTETTGEDEELKPASGPKVTGSVVAGVVTESDADDKGLATKGEADDLGDKSSYLDSYNKGMRRSMTDKFDYIVKQIPNFDKEVGVVFDFGTGDGELIKRIAERDKKSHINRKYIGYDIAPEMVAAAKRNVPLPNALFTDKLDEARKAMEDGRKNGKKSVLILSSVVHEIMHYQKPDVQKKFWDSVWQTGADYVAIRDFSLPGSLAYNETKPRVLNAIKRAYGNVTFPSSHPLAGKKVLDVWQNGFEPIQGHGPEFAAGFKGWGPLEKEVSAVHFLMSFNRLEIDAKDENLQREGIREMKENYGLTFSNLVKKIPIAYEPIFAERGVTPARAKVLKDEFGIDVAKDDIPPMKIKTVVKRRTDIKDPSLFEGKYHTSLSYIAKLAERDLETKYGIKIHANDDDRFPQQEGGILARFDDQRYARPLDWLAYLLKKADRTSLVGDRDPVLR